MRHGERDEVVVAALEPHVAGLQLDELERVGQLAEDPPQRAEELLQAGRAIDRQRQLAPPQGEGLQHPRQAEVVVGVVVRDEHFAQLDQADGRAQQLPLRALAAVEQQALAAAPEQQRGRRPLGRRHRARGAEEDEVQIHGASLGGLGVMPLAVARPDYGSSSTWPGARLVPASPFSRWITQTPWRGSPW